MDPEEAAVRRIALIVLGVVLVTIVVALVVVAVATDRHITTTIRSLVVGLVLIALTGGAVLVWPGRKSRDD